MLGENISQGTREPHYTRLATSNSPKGSSGPSSFVGTAFQGQRGPSRLGCPRGVRAGLRRGRFPAEPASKASTAGAGQGEAESRLHASTSLAGPLRAGAPPPPAEGQVRERVGPPASAAVPLWGFSFLPPDTRVALALHAGPAAGTAGRSSAPRPGRRARLGFSARPGTLPRCPGEGTDSYPPPASFSCGVRAQDVRRIARHFFELGFQRVNGVKSLSSP